MNIGASWFCEDCWEDTDVKNSSDEKTKLKPNNLNMILLVIYEMSLTSNKYFLNLNSVLLCFGANKNLKLKIWI